jgi:LemA protein
MIGYYNNMKAFQNLLEQKKFEILNTLQKKRLQEQNLAMIFTKLTNYEKSMLTQLTSNFNNLIAISQAYPTLMSNVAFNESYNQISVLNNEIQSKVEMYNLTITEYNNNIRQFPKMILAFVFRFKVKIYAEIK